MNIFKNRKKSGFTLMEVAIAVMIVGLLTVICIPVVQRQLEKSDEYAYYMAYRSVEKLGGQIVALGDPEDAYYNTSISNGIKLALDKKTPFQTLKNKITVIFSSLGQRFAYTEKYLFKNLFPKSFAEEDWMSESTISDDDYYNANLAYRVCEDNEQIQKPDPSGTDATGNPIYENYKCSEFRDLYSSRDGVISTPIDSLLPENGCFIGLSDTQKAAKKAELENFIKADKSTLGEISVKKFCEKLAQGYCVGVDSEQNREYKTLAPYLVEDSYVSDGEPDEPDDTPTANYVCDIAYRNLSSSSSGSSNNATQPARPTVTNICTEANGYYGMYNSGGDYSVSCECKLGKLPTQNNDKVCCPQMTGLNSYSRSDINSSMSESTYCKNCLGDFNPIGNWCCPDYSVFNGSECQCVEGYKMNNAKGTSAEECIHTGCAKGSHLDKETEICVPNPPLLKADRFCNLINQNWNTTAHKCDTFSTVNNSKVYNAVLEAAKSTSGNYLSIQSKNGAFNHVTPNIILTNGLRLWILGDKAASIPGLSYNPMNISSTQNMCQELFSGTNTPLSTKDKCDARGGYFCKGEAHCYTLDATSLTKMGDARNCCSSTDISDLAHAANAEKDNRAFAISGFTIFVDINGDKGSGTLWEDVFPFFVGADGRVYPGYPLDADKNYKVDSTSEAAYLGGNSVKNLPVDVYYYENDSRNDNSRKKVIVYSNVSYAKGLCFSKILNVHTPYCRNLGLKMKENVTGETNDVTKIKDFIESPSNDCNTHNCFLSVRNKLRFF